MSAETGERAFLGRGWAFPVELSLTADGRTRVAEAAHEELVQQAIWIILATAPGERPMRPDFGCGIHDLVFSVDTAATRSAVADAVRDALLRWEPRIDLRDVAVRSRPGAPATLLIEIEYRVRSTNNLFNVVYPFYAERGLG
jgi:phage baseplate assembly protein W